MPKRKREFDEEKANKSRIHGDSSANLAPREHRVFFKYNEAAAKLAHAFRVAKSTERLKLGRRSRAATAEKKEQDVQRIEAEIKALKGLENAACAQNYLCKSLLRIKAVAQSPRLPRKIAQPVTLPLDPAALNVHARLCSSNPVKEALPQCLAEVQAAIGIKAEAGPKKKRLRAKDYQAKAEEAERETVATNEKDPDQLGTNIREDVDIGSDDEFADYDDRLASSGDDESNDIHFPTTRPDIGEDELRNEEKDDNDEDLDIQDLERQLQSEGLSKRQPPQLKYDHAADLSLSDSEPQDYGLSPDRQQSKLKPPSTANIPRPKKSSFLPSLSNVGYISGSDSDFDLDDEIDVAPRKNRPGQRARQQIWEKKYGTKAKHLQKPGSKRSDGWDPKRGATDGRGRAGHRKDGHARLAKSGRGGGFGDKGQAGSSGHRPVVPKKHRDDNGPIHPSWEAAKKAKEKREAPVTFQGTKVTFD